MLAASRRRVWHHPFDGSQRDPSAARGPRRRASCRFRRFNRSRARRSGAGLGINWPSESTARCRMPRSTPMAAHGRPGWSDCSSDLTGERDKPATPGSHDCRRHDPCGSCSRRRASFRVDSCVRMRPSRGRVTWWRSASTRMAPVVNRQDSAPLPFRLRLGKRIRGPARCPCLLSCQFLRARASASRPDEYASLEF